jgi:hypothetical protein
MTISWFICILASGCTWTCQQPVVLEGTKTSLKGNLREDDAHGTSGKCIVCPVALRRQDSQCCSGRYPAQAIRAVLQAGRVYG